QVALRDVRNPTRVLDWIWVVQSEILAQGLIIFGRRPLAQDDQHRVARRELEQHEQDHTGQKSHRDHDDESPHDVARQRMLARVRLICRSRKRPANLETSRMLTYPGRGRYPLR